MGILPTRNGPSLLPHDVQDWYVEFYKYIVVNKPNHQAWTKCSFILRDAGSLKQSLLLNLAADFIESWTSEIMKWIHAEVLHLGSGPKGDRIQPASFRKDPLRSLGWQNQQHHWNYFSAVELL